LDIRAGQKLAWENKVAKGFNTTDVPLEFCLLQAEVEAKIEKNASRVCSRLPNGVLVKGVGSGAEVLR
jgi:hypothetical protein